MGAYEELTTLTVAAFTATRNATRAEIAYIGCNCEAQPCEHRSVLDEARKASDTAYAALFRRMSELTREGN